MQGLKIAEQIRKKGKEKWNPDNNNNINSLKIFDDDDNQSWTTTTKSIHLRNIPVIKLDKRNFI